MPRALRQAGNHTAHFGKWHLGGGSGSFRNGKLYINHPDAPAVAAYGFDQVRADFGNAPTWKHALPVDKPHELYPYDEPEWQTWSSCAISDATTEFLENHMRRHADRPFLVHAFFKDSHTPMKPTDAMRAPYTDVSELAQTHYAMVRHSCTVHRSLAGSCAGGECR
jgi:arylsulfatase A-like enzyme